MTDPRTSPATLHVVGAPEGLSAAKALAWCWPAPGRDVIGFGYGVDRAPWFRLEADDPCGPAGRPLGLDGLYEIVAFDVDRELRWLLDIDGVTTRAVVLAEDPAALPDDARHLPDSNPHEGVRGPHARLLHRFTPDDGPVPAHLLAEHVSRYTTTPAPAPLPEGWARLHSDRYTDALVPYRWPSPVPAPDDPDLRLALEYVEYVTEDEHGNLTVAETRLTGIRPYDGPRSDEPQKETR